MLASAYKPTPLYTLKLEHCTPWQRNHWSVQKDWVSTHETVTRPYCQFLNQRAMIMTTTTTIVTRLTHDKFLNLVENTICGKQCSLQISMHQHSSSRGAGLTEASSEASSWSCRYFSKIGPEFSDRPTKSMSKFEDTSIREPDRNEKICDIFFKSPGNLWRIVLYGIILRWFIMSHCEYN